jgi:hypothetical protein
MNDGTIAHGDIWLPVAVPAILSSAAVTALVIGEGVPKRFQSQVPYTHWSLLRTIKTA